ncbi:hypothetical protein [Micromonospora sp. RTP1Z1]|uniref:hypothetical protein n=1 Tax=Micromonospora sp. RTP1Z1 TaxID=2994043 RepID=UPI0029C6EF29|nr:hypothetical protein [Micromonospora sp. RTP1Z1]
MSHPQPQPGPSRHYRVTPAAYLDVEGRRDRAKAAAIAGSYGRSASPMTGTRRLAAYVRQSNRAAFTPRQWRRYVHKANRSASGAA